MTNEAELTHFYSCKKCVAAAQVRGVRVSEYERLSVGVSADGELQLRCNRHHVIFAKIPIDTHWFECHAPVCVDCAAGRPHTH
jgi:hypothetical protein